MDSGPKYVQVKGLGNTNKTVKVSDKSIDSKGFDYMVIVDFESGICSDLNLKNEFYILNLNEIDSIYKNKNKTKKEKMRLQLLKKSMKEVLIKINGVKLNKKLFI